ncbi:Notchless protein 1 [Blattella germanica]|nr:Notchless protein 1 [Blattella germanica]
MNNEEDTIRVLSRFKSETGEVTSTLLDLPINVTVDKLQLMCNALLKQEDDVPYVFYVNEKEITKSLEDVLEKDLLNLEEVVDIVYQQQAIFKVRAVTRCTSSLPGHAEAVVSVSFSPDGCRLASGSGDTTVRLWDISTQTPHHTCYGHKHWVLCIAWSPDGKKLASACKNGQIMLWDPVDGKQIGRTLSGHKQWITSLSWEPYHRNVECRRLASGSKDGDIRIWDVILGQTMLILTGHSKAVTVVKWGGTGLLYSASQDRTIKVWRTEDECALKRYENASPTKEERLVSGSDDFTLFLWLPEIDKKPLARMTGHQQLINDVKFSVDSRLIASASFDKSIKIWNGQTGKFITSLRGHVQAVYQIAWSPDSRLLVSGSADSTLKDGNIKMIEKEDLSTKVIYH